MFSFNPPVNFGKTFVSWCFQEDQKETLGRKGSRTIKLKLTLRNFYIFIIWIFSLSIIGKASSFSSYDSKSIYSDPSFTPVIWSPRYWSLSQEELQLSYGAQYLFIYKSYEAHFCFNEKILKKTLSQIFNL